MGRLIGILICLYLCSQYFMFVCSSILAVKCMDGIILAYDSAEKSVQSLSMSNPWVEKVFPVTSNTVICSACSCSGNEGADFKEFLREIREEVFDYKLTEANVINVETESMLGLESIYFLAKKLIRHKYPSIHVFITGFCGDSRTDKNSFKLFEVLPGGTGIEGENLLVAGSGGVNIVSLLSDILLSESSITVQKAIPKVKRALSTATKLDHGSGGRPVLWTLARPSTAS